MYEKTGRISALFHKYGLGNICGTIEPVLGGLMHKMYKVRTESGVYAVKCLNPEIMKRPGVLDNYSSAEELERVLEKEDIPIVPALSFDGKKMIEDDGKYYYIFRWQEGSITDSNAISKQQCYQAGEILGRIHDIDPHNVSAEEVEISEIDFEAYILEADRKNSGIAGIISDNLILLKEAQDKLNNARRMLPAMSAIDDPDMDPKNIMWHEGKAYVIDLECLERGNPIATCLNLALQWAGTVNGKYSGENLRSFFQGYLSAYDNGFRSYDELFGISYTWVEWLEYNIRRALGMEGSNADDIRLGEEEVRNTIDRIKYLRDIEEDVCKELACLEAPDPHKFKTHDKGGIEKGLKIDNMKIAVMADIHSNHVALEKCIDEAKRLGADEFIFLGDYVGEMAYPERTLECLAKLKQDYPCTFIRGNKENYWIDHKNGKHDDWIWQAGTSGSGMLQYSYTHLTDAQIKEFENMPIAKVMQYDHMPPFVICHGSPFKVNESLREDYDYIDALTERLETELTICGHFHIQTKYVRNGKRVINPGAVGAPLRSGGKAQFMILLACRGIWNTEFHTLAYDVEKTIQEMDEEKLSIQAPGWYRVVKAVLLGKDVSQFQVLSKACELCEKEEGKVDWKCVPEKYWDRALATFGI